MRSIFLIATCSLAAALASPACASQPTLQELQQFAAVLTQGFFDPASTQVRNVTYGHEGHMTIFCGEVNAKNRFGGYTGYRPFIVAAGERIISDGTPGQDARLVAQQPSMCGADREAVANLGPAAQ